MRGRRHEDGHNSGLYDWHYLYKLGENRRELWDLYLERMEKAGERRNGPDPVDALEVSGISAIRRAE